MNEKIIIESASLVRNFIIDRYDRSDTYCAISSSILNKQLNLNNIKNHIACNDEHAFILINDYLLDVTADQFGMYDDITWEEYKCKSSVCFWTISKKFRNYKNFVKYQFETKWPIQQIVDESHFKDFDNYLMNLKRKCAS